MERIKCYRLPGKAKRIGYGIAGQTGGLGSHPNFRAALGHARGGTGRLDREMKGGIDLIFARQYGRAVEDRLQIALRIETAAR